MADEEEPCQSAVAPDPEWRQIGAKVREQRREMDLSIPERAMALGIPWQTYARAEAGTLDPREVLGVDENGNKSR